jgi:hypothetical protein
VSGRRRTYVRARARKEPRHATALACRSVGSVGSPGRARARHHLRLSESGGAGACTWWGTDGPRPVARRRQGRAVASSSCRFTVGLYQ